VVDFFCPGKKIAIEVDGDVHAFDKQMKQDKKREDFLRKLGIKIIRYTNNDILENIEGVMGDLYTKVV
jgi:very-short-patch-repair endonuclease